MYICLCKNVTCKDIRNAADQGARNMRDLSQRFGIGTQCGKCVRCAHNLLKDCAVNNNLQGEMVSVEVTLTEQRGSMR